MTIEITPRQRAVICYGLACAKAENVHYLRNYPESSIKNGIEVEIETIDEILELLLYNKAEVKK